MTMSVGESQSTICDSDNSHSSTEYWRCRVWIGVNGPGWGDVGLEYPEGIECEEDEEGEMSSMGARSMGCSGMVSG